MHNNGTPNIDEWYVRCLWQLFLVGTTPGALDALLISNGRPSLWGGWPMGGHLRPGSLLLAACGPPAVL